VHQYQLDMRPDMARVRNGDPQCHHEAEPSWSDPINVVNSYDIAVHLSISSRRMVAAKCFESSGISS